MKQYPAMRQISHQRVFLIVLAFPLACSVVCAVFWSLRWPLVGDASLMHYVVFLMSKGKVLYEDIIDINMPGTYCFETISMHLFGWGALAWRIYDLVLLLSIGGAALLINRQRSLFAGFFAAAMFALVHIQDGFAQLGQRDLLIAALLLCSYAALFSAQLRLKPGLLLLLFALFMGATVTIKPAFLPLGVLLLLISARPMCRSGRSSDFSFAHHFGYGAAGLLLPSFCAVLWLHAHGALSAFLEIVHTQMPLYAGLNRKPFSYLIAHLTSPIVVVCILWLVLLPFLRPKLTLERVELLSGVGVAFLSYVAQGKGLPYHRYPFLALLLVLMGMDLVEALGHPRIPRLVAGLTLASACLMFAPRAAWLVHSFVVDTPFEQALSTQLSSFGPQISGQIQCLDAFGGCINTLYDLRLVQSTGYLSDCYLFSTHPNPLTALYRADFWAAYQAARPKVIVVTDQFCFGDSSGFHKLDRWPELRDELARDYVQNAEWQSATKERWWARSEYPPRYRIYVSKDSGWGNRPQNIQLVP